MNDRPSNVHRSSRLAIRQGVSDETSIARVAVQSALFRSLILAAWYRALPELGHVTS